MRKLIFTILILLPCILSAQNAVRSNHSFSVNFVGIDYGYELRTEGAFSLIVRAGFDNTQAAILDGAGKDYDSDPLCGCGSDDQLSNWDMGFALAMETRFYYNSARRANLGKNIDLNSADFVSVEIRMVSNPVNRDYEALYPVRFAAMWGIRRVYGGHWLIEGNTGINLYSGVHSEIAWGPRLNARFGFVF